MRRNCTVCGAIKNTVTFCPECDQLRDTVEKLKGEQVTLLRTACEEAKALVATSHECNSVASNECSPAMVWQILDKVDFEYRRRQKIILKLESHFRKSSGKLPGLFDNDSKRRLL